MRQIYLFLICAVLITACKSPIQEEPTAPVTTDTTVTTINNPQEDYLGPINYLDGMPDWQNLGEVSDAFNATYFDILGGATTCLGLASDLLGCINECFGLARASLARKNAAAAVKNLQEIEKSTKDLINTTNKYRDSLVFYTRRAISAIESITEKTRMEQQLQRQQMFVSILNQDLALTASMRNDSMAVVLCNTLDELFDKTETMSEEAAQKEDLHVLSELYPVLHEWIGPDNRRYKDFIAYIDWALNTKDPLRQWDIIQIEDNIAQDMNAWNYAAELQKAAYHTYRSSVVNAYAMVIGVYLSSCILLDKPTRHTYANANDIYNHLADKLAQYNDLLLSHPLKMPNQIVCNVYGCHFTADTMIYAVPYPDVTYAKDYIATPDSIVFGFDSKVSANIMKRSRQLTPKEVQALYRYYYPYEQDYSQISFVEDILVNQGGMTKQPGNGTPWLLLNGLTTLSNRALTCTAVNMGKKAETDYQGIPMGDLQWNQNTKHYTGWETDKCWYRLNIVKH